MAEGGIPTEYCGDESEWGPGVKEAMRSYDISEKTIDILGEEGYNTFRRIDRLDVDSLRIELVHLSIKSADRCSFLTMVKARRRHPLELDLEQNSEVLPTEHREVLRKCKPELLEKLILLEVPNLLHSDGVLTDAQYENCNAIPTRYKKSEYLLGILDKQSERSFLSFMRALRSTKQQHLANYIEEYLSRGGKY